MQGRGRVFSIEPGPISFGLLRANFFNRQFNNIILLDKAASDRGGNTYLFINQNGESAKQFHHELDQYHWKDEPSHFKYPIDTET